MSKEQEVTNKRDKKLIDKREQAMQKMILDQEKETKKQRLTS